MRVSLLIASFQQKPSEPIVALMAVNLLLIAGLNEPFVTYLNALFFFGFRLQGLGPNLG